MHFILNVEVFVVQMVSYINYELDLGVPGLGGGDTPYDVITMPLWDNNTPSPGSTEKIKRELAAGAGGGGAGAELARQSK